MKKTIYTLLFALLLISCEHDSSVVCTVRYISPGCGYTLDFAAKKYIPDASIPVEFQQDSLKVKIVFNYTDTKIYCDSLFDTLEVIHIKSIVQP